MQEITLPDSLMRAIELIIKDADTEPERSYVAALMITFGHALWKEQGEAPFDPRTVAIPDEQWTTIAGWFTERPGSDVDRVNWGLSWMNAGPSAWKPS